jgi:hypothetical protein
LRREIIGFSSAGWVVVQGAQRLTGAGCSESDLAGVLVDESLPPHEASMAAAITEAASVLMSL